MNEDIRRYQVVNGKLCYKDDKGQQKAMDDTQLTNLFRLLLHKIDTLQNSVEFLQRDYTDRNNLQMHEQDENDFKEID